MRVVGVCAHDTLVHHAGKWYCYNCERQRPPPTFPLREGIQIFKPAFPLGPDASVHEICHAIAGDMTLSPVQCDFCREQRMGVLATFRCQPFILAGKTDYVDDGEWAACPMCAPLLEAGRYQELLERAVKGNVRVMGGHVDRGLLRRGLDEVLSAFWRLRLP